MKRTLALSCLLALNIVAASSTAAAQHSFAAMIDARKPIRLVGTLTKIEWAHPHSYFFIDVPAGDGRVNNWTIEGAGSSALSRRGFNKGDVKVGDTLIVRGYLARSSARIVDGRLVTLPHGRVINAGTPAPPCQGAGGQRSGRSEN